MAENEIKFLHSNGPNNKNPDLDLGSYPSKFEIAALPNNNLFCDVSPEQAYAGLTDYRCFYIFNKYLDTDYDVTINTGLGDCSSINMGSVAQNEIQQIVFQGNAAPVANGFFIIQLDWGPELVINWDGSWSAMAANMQSQIRLVKYHEDVTVTVTSSTTTDAKFTVVFLGQLVNRKMGLIRIVQNNLSLFPEQEYRVDNTNISICNCNVPGSTFVQVSDIITNILHQPGMIHIPYPLNNTYISTTWGYMHLSYTDYSSNMFALITPIPDLGGAISLGNNDSVWIDLPNTDATTVNVKRMQEGYPINQVAQAINYSTNNPIGWTNLGSSFHVGLLKPSEGFFVWVKRTVSPSSSGCQDGFSLTLDGTRVS